MFGIILILASFATKPPTPQPVFPAVFHVAAYRGVRYSDFATGESTDCEDSSPPVPLSTPNPLEAGDGAALSIIVGQDGHVYSPLVLVSGGTLALDRAQLKAVSGWLYRPATCNGVPVDSEGKVIFLVE